MFSKVFAAAALAVVSAADVPLFSSNDDYDEINLNIRMLSNHSSGVTTHTLAAKARVTATFPTGTTAATLNSNTAFKTAFCNTVKSVDGIDATICTVSSVTDAARRARALTVSLTLEIAYALTFSSATALSAAQSVVDDTSATSAFATKMNSDLATNVGNAGGPAMSGVSSTSSGQTGTNTPGAAAAPSPSPSSNAAKLAVSGLGAFAAFMATML